MFDQAIWSALRFGIQGFVWIVQISFACSTAVNRMLFQSLLLIPGISVILEQVFLAVMLTGGLWATVGWILVSVNGGTGDEILTGLVVGAGWGIVSGMRAYNEWCHELMMRPPAEYEVVDVLDEPVDVRQAPSEITPDVIDEFDDTPLDIQRITANALLKEVDRLNGVPHQEQVDE